MIAPAIPTNDSERLDALYSYQILNSLPEKEFNDIIEIASAICGVPVSLISLVDKDRCWFKAKMGIEGNEAPRDIAYAAHAINFPTEITVIEDAWEDEQWKDGPLATGENPLRFYAGTPLVDSGGFVLGTLCVADHKPRTLDENHKKALRTLAEQVITQFELKKNLAENERLSKKNKLLIKRLIKKNKELDQFSYVVSHDLKEPVRTIKNMIQILKEDHIDNDGDANVIMDYIQGASDRMSTLINHLLEYARIGKDFVTDSINTQELLQDVTADLGRIIHDSNATIHFGELHHMQANTTEIRQLFQNLIKNAIKFTSEDVDPVIHISSKEDDQAWYFQVADNGIGVQKDQEKQIFKMLKKPHGNKYEGYGIGLAFCKKIAHHHGGEIGVDSNPTGGSIFHFSIAKDNLLKSE